MITGRASQQEQCTKGVAVVGIDGPLQIGGAGREAVADRRQRDRHHRPGR